MASSPNAATFIFTQFLKLVYFHKWCKIILFFKQNNHNGFKLKELIIENGIVAKALKYLEKQTPQKPFR